MRVPPGQRPSPAGRKRALRRASRSARRYVGTRSDGPWVVSHEMGKIPVAERIHPPRRQHRRHRRSGRGGRETGGIADHGTKRRTTQQPGRPVSLSANRPVQRDPETNPEAVTARPTRARQRSEVPRGERATAARVGRRRGTTAAEAEGERESEGREVAKTTGKGRQPDPEERRRPVSRTNFWREP